MILMLCSVFILGQDNSFSYAVEEDEPNFSFVQGGITIVDFTGNGHGSNIGFGADFNAAYKKIGFFSKYKLGVGIMEDATFGLDAISIYNRPNTSISFECNLSFAISEKEEKEDFRVTLKSKNDTNFVSDIPGTLTKTGNIEVGFVNGSEMYATDDFKFSGIPQGGTQPVSFENVGGQYILSNYNYNLLTFGYSIIKKHDLIIQTDKYGYKRSSGFKRIYGHLTYLLNSDFEDVAVSAGSYVDHGSEPSAFFRYDINEGTEFSKMGFTVGVQSFSPKGFGFSTLIEGGVLPGPKVGGTSNLFVRVSAGISLSTLFR